MKILFITNVVPNAVGGGTPQRAATHLRALREIGEVTMVLPPTDGVLPGDVAGVSLIERGHALTDIRLWDHEGSRSWWKRPLHGLRRLSLVDGRASAREARAMRRALEGQFDLVFAFRLRSAIWWETVFGSRQKALRVVDFDDVESIIACKRNERAGGPWWWQAKLRYEERWIRHAERRVARQWNAAILCSRLDAGRFEQLTGVEPWILPNSYRFGPFPPESPGVLCRLLFVGTFSYFPNSEGVQWFVEAIWPRVRDVLGAGANLWLIGLNPLAEILALDGKDGITVAGNVPSVSPYYKEANIVIAPLRAGSGTRIKLIEAAALGRAIVTTALGCEGLGFVDGVHAEIADDPADFAQRIIALARDPARRTRLADAARDYARQVYSVDTVTTTLAGKLRHLIGQAAEARASLSLGE